MIHVTLFQGTAGKTKYGFVVEPNRKSDCMGFIRAKCGVGIGIKVRWLKNHSLVLSQYKQSREHDLTYDVA